MARQTIDLGTSPNRGDGDPLRTAFDKVNDNFAELYAGNFAEPSATGSSLIPDTDATYDLGSADKQWADLYVKDFIYLNGARLETDANGNLRLNGAVIAADSQGSVFADDSTLLVDAVNGIIPWSVIDGAPSIPTQISQLTGDYTGSVFADDSTLLVDGVNGTIPGYINTADLKTLVAASTDFADFQARIAAL